MEYAEVHIEEIPSVPQVLLELLRLFHQPMVEFGDIAHIIEQDPAISAKILHIANTSFYRQWSEIKHIRQLLVVMGIDEVRHIAVTSAICQYFSQFSEHQEDIVTAIWARSLLCGHIAQELARLVGYHSPDEAYTTGLLSRFGQLVLLKNHPDTYLDILFMDDPDSAVEQAEKKLFNASHAQLGAAVIRHWPLHPFVADAILFQNTPQAALSDASNLVKLLNLAANLTQSVLRGPDTPDTRPHDDLFGLNEALLAECRDRARRTVLDCAHQFGIHSSLIFPSTDKPNREEKTATHRQMRHKLSQYVRHAALTGSSELDASPADTPEQIFDRIRQELTIAFGLQDIHFLTYDEKNHSLHPLPTVDDGQDLLRELHINVDKSASLAARALKTGRIHCTLDFMEEDDPAAVIDQQLCRLLHQDGLLFLPLRDCEKYLGVIFAGVSESRWQRIKPPTIGIELFSQHISRYMARTLRLIDIHRKKLTDQQEEMRVEARKLAHEINNPLSIINTYLFTLTTKLGEDHDASDEISVIREEILRIGGILARLREIGTDKEDEKGPLQLNQTIEDLIKLFQQTWFKGKAIQTEISLDGRIPPLAVGSAAVKQILINLVRNAVEALPDDGLLRITTRDGIYKNGQVFVGMKIEDNGPGISPEILKNLFKPVVSTKKDHSGLGLSIVKNLVDRMGGEISCVSDPETGTIFDILIPRRTVDSGSGSESGDVSTSAEE